MICLKLASYQIDSLFIDKLSANHLAVKEGKYYLTFNSFPEHEKFINGVMQILKELESESLLNQRKTRNNKIQDCKDFLDAIATGVVSIHQ